MFIVKLIRKVISWNDFLLLCGEVDGVLPGIVREYYAGNQSLHTVQKEVNLEIFVDVSGIRF